MRREAANGQQQLVSGWCWWGGRLLGVHEASKVFWRSAASASFSRVPINVVCWLARRPPVRCCTRGYDLIPRGSWLHLLPASENIVCSLSRRPPPARLIRVDENVLVVSGLHLSSGAQNNRVLIGTIRSGSL